MAEQTKQQTVQAAEVEKQQTSQEQQDPEKQTEGILIAMYRNNNFDPGWLPFKNDSTVHIIEGTTGGAFKWFNPTRARFAQVPDLIGMNEDFDVTDENALPPNAEYDWSSRDIRKGRHALVLNSGEKGERESNKYALPPPTSTLKGTLKSIGRMFTVFPIDNISWLIAITFTMGSIIWILSSFFAFIPIQAPEHSFPGMSAYGCGISACVGSVVFFIGSILLLLESVKDNRDTDFGWTVNQEWDEESRTSVYRVTPQHKPGLGNQQREFKAWKPPVRLPSWRDFKEHYVYELAFWTAVIQVCSSTLFLISGITAVPGIYDRLSTDLVDGFYWAPKLAACCGFITSGLMSMIECQESFFKPAFDNLGWHVSLWKVIGSIGFLLVPAFGLNRADWAQYQSTVHCLWGSFAFFICSVLLWYESLTQYTVEYPQEQLKHEIEGIEGRRATHWSDSQDSQAPLAQY